MTENLSERLRQFLAPIQGSEVSYDYLRRELRVDPESPAWDGIRTLMGRLVIEKIVKPTGKKDGTFKVITQVKPVQVFGEKRERRPLFELAFPCDRDTGMEMDFAQHIVFREGDIITIGGVKSKGKTTIALLVMAMNVDKHPVLMGNEYARLVNGVYVPDPRFLARLDRMNEWAHLTDENGMDKFTLLPVSDDYAEHVIGGRINIFDWVSLNANALYDIGAVLRDIKAAIGGGIGIAVLQKGEGAVNPRGGQFVRDYSDLELLLDGYGDNDDDILLTIKGCKEKRAPIVGKTYTYTIVAEGTEIANFREVKKCTSCRGEKYVRGKVCEDCYGSGWKDTGKGY